MIYPNQYYARRDQGGRDDQQDDLGFYTPNAKNPQAEGFLFALADGMGGCLGGAKASRTAIQSFINAYCSIQGALPHRMQQALLHANRQIAIDADDPQYQGMGCTLVAATFNQTRLDWISVGDSVLWLWRNDQLRRLNADHSMKPEIAKQVKKAEISAEEAEQSREKNVLRSVLMGETIPLIDQNHIDWQSADIYLMASDGVETLSEAYISQVLQKNQKKSAKIIGDLLLDAIPTSDYQDNASLIIVKPKATQIRTRFIILIILTALFVSGIKIVQTKQVAHPIQEMKNAVGIQ